MVEKHYRPNFLFFGKRLFEIPGGRGRGGRTHYNQEDDSVNAEENQLLGGEWGSQSTSVES